MSVHYFSNFERYQDPPPMPILVIMNRLLSYFDCWTHDIKTRHRQSANVGSCTCRWTNMYRILLMCYSRGYLYPCSYAIHVAFIIQVSGTHIRTTISFLVSTHMFLLISTCLHSHQVIPLTSNLTFIIPQKLSSFLKSYFHPF